jgi:hypothetical protein
MHARRHFCRRPCLEVLEDRAVPAVVSPPATLATELNAEIALSQTVIVSIAPPTVAVGAVTPRVDEVVSGPAATLAVGALAAPFVQTRAGALPADLPTLPFSPDVGALGFPGRVVFPGTGLLARVANGDGPLTEPPGLFLRGLSTSPSADAEQPAPRPSAARVKEAAAVAPRDEGARPDVLEQPAWLRELFSLIGNGAPE